VPVTDIGGEATVIFNNAVTFTPALSWIVYVTAVATDVPAGTATVKDPPLAVTVAGEGGKDGLSEDTV
jgi:hypothetical protein